MSEHSKTLRERVASTAALPMREQERKELDALRPDLDAYVREAEHTLDILARKGDAKTAFAAFSQRFDALEKSMGAFSATLERTSQTEQDAAREVAEHTGQSLLLALLACMACLICLDILIGRSITRSLDGIRQFLAGLGNRLDQRLHSQGDGIRAEIQRQRRLAVAAQRFAVVLVEVPRPAHWRAIAIHQQAVLAAHLPVEELHAQLTLTGRPGSKLLTEKQILAAPADEYMSPAQLAFFRARLVAERDALLESAHNTTEHLQDYVATPDPADRATIEEEHALELRTRDRERKLLKKIEQSIASIDAGEYGYCDETGEPIGVPRLLARPTATLSLEAQQRRELKQKMFGD